MTEIPKTIAWYVKYRTQLWAGVFFIVGAFGGNVDRIKTWLPTTQYSNEEIVQELKTEIQTLREDMDRLKKSQDIAVVHKTLDPDSSEQVQIIHYD